MLKVTQSLPKAVVATLKYYETLCSYDRGFRVSSSIYGTQPFGSQRRRCKSLDDDAIARLLFYRLQYQFLHTQVYVQVLFTLTMIVNLGLSFPELETIWHVLPTSSHLIPYVQVRIKLELPMGHYHPSLKQVPFSVPLLCHFLQSFMCLIFLLTDYPLIVSLKH